MSDHQPEQLPHRVSRHAATADAPASSPAPRSRARHAAGPATIALDTGVGVCGKDGQSVPVGVGQPTMRIDAGLTVGGSET